MEYELLSSFLLVFHCHVQSVATLHIGEIGLYDGGGYVFELNKGTEYLMNRTKLLEDQAWIDRYTRAIFIEFTVYNPGTNLFAINTLLLEKPDSGSFYPVYR